MQFKICSKVKIIFIFFFLVFNQQNLHSLENKIILKIDNEIITSLDIENEIKYLIALNPSIKNLDKEKIYSIGRNSLIREKIKKNEILKYMNELKIDQKFLDILIKNRYSKLNIETKKKFIDYLKINQVNISTIEDKISIEAIWNQLIYKKFSTKLKINKDDLKNKIKKTNNIKNKSYLLSEIYFKISDKTNLKKKYDEISSIILDSGFESAALTYSISDSSGIGGKLGWIKEDSLNKVIKENLSKLELNDITEPIFTPNGYLILKIKDIKFSKKKYDEEQELKNLINYETNQQLTQYSNNYFNKIKKNITINEL